MKNLAGKAHTLVMFKLLFCMMWMPVIGGSQIIFDVMSFGGKADGVTDDSQAVLAAWKAACNVESAVLQVRKGFTALVNPVTLTGPCKPDFTLQIDGTILAPTIPSAWNSRPLQWLNLKNLQDFHIRGSGTIDGQGTAWWANKSNKMPGTHPTALRFYGGKRLTVGNITIRNSPQFHLKFDSCSSVTVTGITISSPAQSPNTDGIHLQNTIGAEIQQSTISCGDDCVSIQTGCSDISIHNIVCGPGHGISIGGLGPDGTKACVSNVTVYDSNIINAQNGVRIKTWPGGSGSAREVTFSNITVKNVQMPIVIDQFYCGGSSSSCKRGKSAVAIEGVKFERIAGTYSYMPMHIACSNVIPCTQLSLSDIELHPVTYAKASPYCINTYPSSNPNVTPSLHCYMPGSLSSKSNSISSQC